MRKASSTSTQLGERESSVARVAEEMTLQVKASEQAFAAVRALLSEREVVELTMVVGFYNMVARFLETLEIEIEPRSAKPAR